MPMTKMAQKRSAAMPILEIINKDEAQSKVESDDMKFETRHGRGNEYMTWN